MVLNKMVRLFRKKGEEKRYKVLPKEKSGSQEYIVATQSSILSGELKSKRVKFRGIVSSKPTFLTRYFVFPLSGGGHDHFVVFTLDKGIKVSFTGLVSLREGEEVEVYGVVLKGGEVMAEKIVTETGIFETRY